MTTIAFAWHWKKTRFTTTYRMYDYFHEHCQFPCNHAIPRSLSYSPHTVGIFVSVYPSMHLYSSHPFIVPYVHPSNNAQAQGSSTYLRNSSSIINHRQARAWNLKRNLFSPFFSISIHNNKRLFLSAECTQSITQPACIYSCWVPVPGLCHQTHQTQLLWLYLQRLQRFQTLIRQHKPAISLKHQSLNT